MQVTWYGRRKAIAWLNVIKQKVNGGSHGSMTTIRRFTFGQIKVLILKSKRLVNWFYQFTCNQQNNNTTSPYIKQHEYSLIITELAKVPSTQLTTTGVIPDQLTSYPFCCARHVAQEFKYFFTLNISHSTSPWGIQPIKYMYFYCEATSLLDMYP